MEDLILGYECKIDDIVSVFKGLFGVNLDDEKYGCGRNIEDIWQNIISDIYGTNERGKYNEKNEDDKDKKEKRNGRYYYRKFVQTFHMINMNEKIQRGNPKREFERNQELGSEIEQLCDELTNAIDSYEIYEDDVWINVYLILQDLKSEDNDHMFESEVGEDEIDQYKLLDKNIQIDCGWIEFKGKKISVPFISGPDNNFCIKYMESLMKRDAWIFDTDFYYKKDVRNIKDRNSERKEKKDYIKVKLVDASLESGENKYRIELDLSRDKRYDRWSRDVILKLENERGFLLEDQLLFCKTVNGVLSRNILDAMIYAGSTYPIEDCLYLIKRLASCRSLGWQNVIGCMFFSNDCFRNISKLDYYSEIYAALLTCLSFVEKINYYVACFSKGLEYLILKYDEEYIQFNVVEKKRKERL